MRKQGRPLGSGSLSREKQAQILRAIKLRKEITTRALAERFNATESVIKSFVHRLNRNPRVELELAEPTEVPSEAKD